jgi:hypothetical protein
MIRRTRIAVGTALSLVALAVAAYVYTHPDRVGNRFLRIGGRIVLKLADRLDVVAALFAVTVLVVWVVIALRCGWEAWAERRRGAHSDHRPDGA